MSSARLASALEVAKVIREDLHGDARALDSTPFTPAGLGKVLGTTLATIDGLAGVVLVLAEELERLERILHSRTEPLA